MWEKWSFTATAPKHTVQQSLVSQEKDILSAECAIWSSWGALRVVLLPMHLELVELHCWADADELRTGAPKANSESNCGCSCIVHSLMNKDTLYTYEETRTRICYTIAEMKHPKVDGYSCHWALTTACVILPLQKMPWFLLAWMLSQVVHNQSGMTLCTIVQIRSSSTTPLKVCIKFLDTEGWF